MSLKYTTYSSYFELDFKSVVATQNAVGYMETIADRLKVLKGDESANAFARRVGIGESLIRKYLNGSMPSLENAAKISTTCNVPLRWIATGVGARDESSLEGIGLPAAIADDISFVPKLELEASAGNGAVTAYDPGTDYIAFQASWLRAHDVNPVAARVLNVHGDSMEPTIRHGDVLLVDTSIDHIKDNAIYVLTWDNSVFVKRVHKRINGSLQLISDNTLYPPEDITKADADQLHIAGRVVWYGRFT